MSNRRKRKQSRKQAQRQARKTRQSEQSRQHVEFLGEEPIELENLYQVDEWDDSDPEHEERIRKERQIKDRRTKKQSELDDYLAA